MKAPATPLVLGMGLTAAIPAASARDTRGRACHKDCVPPNCTLPSPLRLGTA
jgi:hypothetical protein